MKKYFVLILSLSLLICFLPSLSLAQEEETEYAWGTVSSLSAKQIILTEYDYDTDEEVSVVYTLSPNLKLDNVRSLQEIAVGDEVWVDFVIKGDRKTALGIELKKPSYEEYVPEENYEEGSDYSEEEIEY